ncbi:hypothetical protein P389DRAFT_172869 [Cystobasidium minutum MCA 4210]|uniref:uncharacterized protein n=1 Tax=Cystobasidium minutum MCA 4210 TaxID=1397322 RepID=UPI0034CFB9F9|eukprot:jgi/Rhomi1/172869/fgenesh1_kg.5_\
MSSPQHPFHRLLTFFARQNRTSTSNATNTITFIDSLRGDLSLGFNFPLSVLLSLARHLYFRNTPSLLSLKISIPDVKLDRKLLGGPEAYPSIRSDKAYSLSELQAIVKNDTRGGGIKDRLDALSIWTMAARRKDGLVSGSDLRAFQDGTVLESIAKRRKTGRDDVLPFWRGGPISVSGHSWAVKRFFDVDVYRKD